MNCERFDRLIDDYVDGELDEPSRTAAERHLASCVQCRESADELRGLLDRAAALPREIDPPLDLFPALRREIDQRVRPSAPSRAWLGWAGLAASLLLLVTALGVGSDWWRGPAGPVEPVAPEAALADFRAAEREYLRATEMLLDSLEASGGEMSPETAQVIENNLAIIDRAIDEVHLALADEPGNRRNGQVLTALHRQKLQLLLRASRLSS